MKKLARVEGEYTGAEITAKYQYHNGKVTQKTVDVKKISKDNIKINEFFALNLEFNEGCATSPELHKGDENVK